MATIFQHITHSPADRCGSCQWGHEQDNPNERWVAHSTGSGTHKFHETCLNLFFGLKEADPSCPCCKDRKPAVIVEFSASNNSILDFTNFKRNVKAHFDRNKGVYAVVGATAATLAIGAVAYKYFNHPAPPRNDYCWQLNHLLTYKDLSAFPEGAFPEEIRQCKQHITSLFLTHCHIREIPEWIGELSELKQLYLSNNQISSIPESLGRLSKLQTLALSHNQIEKIPETLKNLSELKNFYIYDNEIKDFPNWLGNLTNLERFSILRNRITTAPPSELCNLVQRLGAQLWENPICKGNDSSPFCSDSQTCS
jgi:Leucine-rich repeat (LRR) protein